MTTTVVKPEASVIMSFTQEQIESLPTIEDVSKCTVGGFARKGWMKAPSSLVLILKNGHQDKSSCDFAYVFCNTFNGVISDTCYAGSAYERSYAWGDKYYIHQGVNPYDFNFAH